MPVKLNSSGGGSVTITAPSTASDFTATFPAATGNVVTDSATQTLTNKTLTSPTITGASVSSMASSVITSGTAQASTSGVNIDFTGLPSWVKRITVMFNGVSTNGTAGFSIQLGTSAGIVSSGYSGGVGVGTTYNANSTSFFTYNSATAADLVSGAIVITSFGSNIWAAVGAVFQASNGAPRTSGGTVTLPGTLDRVRIATANGTDTFDAGSINIMYE